MISMSSASRRVIFLGWAAVLVGCGDGAGDSGGAPLPPIPAPPTNRPPDISGIPEASVRSDEAYDFRPIATDPDGDPLSFTIQGRPPWANFDAATGRLSGTPGRTHIGRHDGIVIAVSDGRASAQIGAFTVEVTPPLGNVTINWSPATTNVDGSSLTNLAAHIIYYGLSPLSLDRFAVVENPRLTRYTVGGLAQATWYFAITSYNADGVESGRSDTVSKFVVAD